MIEQREVVHQKFGKCIALSNGIIEVWVTVDLGPRVIHFSRIGGENILFEDLKDEENQYKNKEVFYEAFGEDMDVFHIYGGHRLWAAPEALPRTYYPGNGPVPYELTRTGIRLLCDEQRWTQQKMEIEIVMEKDSDKIDLYHKITNTGAWPQEFAPWCLTVLSQGGKEVIPMPTRKTGLLHNRKLTLWEYTKMNDPRVYWGDRYITLVQDNKADTAFKIGIDSEACWAAYFNHGDMLIKRFDAVQDGRYPDEGMNFETFTNEFILEMESLGELKVVQPGETSCHHESLQLIGGVPCPSDQEDEIDKIVEQYIETDR